MSISNHRFSSKSKNKNITIQNLFVNCKLKIVNLSQGYIALMTVLILTGIMIVMAVFFSQSEILITGFPTRNMQALQAKEHAKSCIEIAFDKFLVSQSYTGNETITFSSGGSCQILTITNVGGQYTVQAVGIFENVTRRAQAVFTFASGEITLVSWTEVASF